MEASDAVKFLASKGIKMLGKSRTSRAKRGKYYVGKRIGIPPAMGRKQNGRRRGAKPSGLNIVTTNSLVPNAAPTVTNQQSSQLISRAGTESLTLKINPNLIVNGDFGIAYSISANPADPGFLKGLAAISNQYQQFLCTALKVTFVPSATTQTPGNVCLAFQPDCNAPDPQSLTDMTGVLGGVTGPFFGKATVLNVMQQCIQRAYNVQTISKSKTALDTTQVSPGKLFVGFSGAGTIPAGGVTIGVLQVTYAYKFGTPKITEGSNQLSCQYIPTAGPVPEALFIDPAARVTGFHMLFPDRPDLHDGVFRPRANMNHLVSTHLTLNEENDHKWQFSDDAIAWSDGNLIANTVDATNHMNATVYILPPARYYRCKMHANSSTLVDGRVYVTTLPTGALTP